MKFLCYAKNMEYMDENAERESIAPYKILSSEHYMKEISEKQGVMPTETIARGDDEGMRAKYIENTERLIELIRHGFESDAEAHGPGADAVFYLDKSARPVAWLTEAFWDVFDDDKPDRKPATHFLNLHAPEGPGGARPERDDMQQIVESGEYDQYIAAMQEVFPDMDGKNILVVDEVSVSGSTEQLAYELFRRAFPGAHIKSAAWMHAGQRRDREGNVFPAEIPIWYKKYSDKGRGVAGINPERSTASASAAQRAGAEILSTRPDEPDLEAAMLRREIQQLARDVQSGAQPIIPYYDIDSPRYDQMQFRQAQTETPKKSLFD